MSRRARLIVPVILVIVVAIVAVSLARGGDDDGSKSATSPDATSSAPPPDPELLLPEPRPEDEARKNRVITRIQRAALKQAPDVASPIISRSQDAGRITAAEAESLRRAARTLARGRSPYQLVDTVDIDDPGIRGVVRRSLAEITRRAKRLAKPIVDSALDRGDITRSQAEEVRAFVASGAGYALP